MPPCPPLARPTSQQLVATAAAPRSSPSGSTLTARQSSASAVVGVLGDAQSSWPDRVCRSRTSSRDHTSADSGDACARHSSKTHAPPT